MESARMPLQPLQRSQPLAPVRSRRRGLLIAAMVAPVVLDLSALGAYVYESTRAEGFELTLEWKTPAGTRTTRVQGVNVTLDETRSAQLVFESKCVLSIFAWLKVVALSEPLGEATPIEKPRGE